MRLTVLSRRQEKRNPTFAAVAAFGRSKKCECNWTTAFGQTTERPFNRFTDAEADRPAHYQVPEDLEQFVNRDTRARFIAYTPAGTGPRRGLAGCSTSYIVRQLYDFKYGTARGLAAPS
jgi:hypothetical protein